MAQINPYSFRMFLAGIQADQGYPADREFSSDRESLTAIIDLIIRDVAELDRNPLPDQLDEEMLVTVGELRAILEDRLGGKIRDDTSTGG